MKMVSCYSQNKKRKGKEKKSELLELVYCITVIAFTCKCNDTKV